MTGKVKEKRDALRRKLIDLGEDRITDGGIEMIRARELAGQAGCAVGAIYNVFGDLNELIMAVNGRTFRRLGAHVLAAVEARNADRPVDVLITMGHAYLDFARNNTPAWRTLFDLNMTDEDDVPDWYREEMRALLAIIAKPVSETFPDFSEKEVAMMTRGLFSSIHGIVLLGLQRRISAVAIEDMERTISLILSNLNHPHK